MRPIFYIVLGVVCFYSCGTPVHYLGQAYAPTTQVDVFISASSIKNPADTIGISYYPAGPGIKAPHKMQKRAVKKAKSVGADALLVTYYSKTDSFATKSSTVIGVNTNKSYPWGSITTQSGPVVHSGFNLYYLKYNQR